MYVYTHETIISTRSNDLPVKQESVPVRRSTTSAFEVTPAIFGASAARPTTWMRHGTDAW